MKANELMIGDLINAFGVVRRVTSIFGLERPEDDGLLTTMIPGCEYPDGNLSFRPCYARPIPLTAEILEKNGFGKCEGNEWSFYKKEEKALYNILWSADELYLEIASYTSLTGEFNRMGIKYIHELQHALRICGLKDVANNFKI